MREELEAGIGVVLSSDALVASYRPLDTIAAAVERRTRRGAAIGAEQALTVEEAIHAHTDEAARAVGMGSLIGSIAAGKLADFVVLERDLFRSSPREIRSTGVWMTVQGGKTVWQAAEGLGAASGGG